MALAGGTRRCQAGRVPLNGTIVALSSGRPPAAIAVIRISGSAAFPIAEAMAGPLPAPRHAALRTLRDGNADILDRGLVLRFPADASVTGEDLVELHCHGGAAVVRAVEAAVLADARARRAEPGEFTRRALRNGRIDLAQAEGLADLLQAETETQRRHAIAATEGHVSRTIHGWMDRLVSIAADVEASIDYGEDGDVEAEAASLAEVERHCAEVAAEIDGVLAAPAVERWRDGIRVVLAGPPNAGKSTLLNLLAGRDAAIVSPVAGTTRDRIEVPVQRDGVAYILSDTAGLREDAVDQIERLGIVRSREALLEADLILWLGDGPPPIASAIRLHTRADQPGRQGLPADAALATRSDARDTIDELWKLIAAHTAAVTLPEVPLHKAEHHLCKQAHAALATMPMSSEPAVVAEHVRVALSLLAEVTGANATELMLDRLFSRFCLGK